VGLAGALGFLTFGTQSAFLRKAWGPILALIAPATSAPHARATVMASATCPGEPASPCSWAGVFAGIKRHTPTGLMQTYRRSFRRYVEPTTASTDPCAGWRKAIWKFAPRPLPLLARVKPCVGQRR